MEHCYRYFKYQQETQLLLRLLALW